MVFLCPTGETLADLEAAEAARAEAEQRAEEGRRRGGRSRSRRGFCSAEALGADWNLTVRAAARTIIDLGGKIEEADGKLGSRSRSAP
jgi:hypothetical protein